jgi:hypothetical protein
MKQSGENAPDRDALRPRLPPAFSLFRIAFQERLMTRKRLTVAGCPIMKRTSALTGWRPITLLIAGLLWMYLAPSLSLPAQDITTLTGRTYHFAKLVRMEPQGAVLDHSTGRTRVAFSDLSRQERAKLNTLAAAPVELPTVVVTPKGGAQFEYNNPHAPLQPSIDLAKRSMELQSDEQRKKEDKKNSHLLFDQWWWTYLPFRLSLGVSDSANDFMTPNYLKTEYQGLNFRQDSPQYNPFGLKW